MLKLHVEHNVKPRSISMILWVFDDHSSISNIEILSQVGSELWPTMNEEARNNYLSKNLRTMQLFGLVESDESYKSTYVLTPLGRMMKRYSMLHQNRFVEMMHYLYYTGYELSRQPEKAFCWTYQQICEHVWMNRSRPINKKNLIDAVVFNANSVFSEHSNLSLSKYAVDGVLNWVRHLEPPFLQISRSNLTTTEGRPFCSPELLILCIDYLYRRKNIDHGEPILLSPTNIDEICRVALLSVAHFQDVLSLVTNMERGLYLKSTQWGRALILDHPVDMTTLLGW